AAGPPAEGGHRYSRQVTEAARLVAAEVGAADHDLVWQSRSGPPEVPWLEPDIVDHLDTVHADGASGVVVCPVGFVSDHLEVLWDLDNEAAERAAELGLGFARSATPNDDPRFARLVAALIREQVESLPAEQLSPLTVGGDTPDGAPCTPDCCTPVRPPTPAS
ncbi:ferrochelatase, partial [Saccharomonospora iraqiensis]|uniref:ferrochelatase n=1 Tax=Saccharomonospora iraqiensis TaxID=52698 RepID=UPI00022DF93C